MAVGFVSNRICWKNNSKRDRWVIQYLQLEVEDFKGSNYSKLFKGSW